jgi:hypothetical protein
MVLKDNTSEQLVTLITCTYIYILYTTKKFYCSKEKFDFLSLILYNLIQVTHRVNEVIKQVCPNIKGKVHGSHIRKLVVSSHREDPTHAISKEELASQTTRNVKTPNKYYYSHGEVKDKLKDTSML